MSLFKYTDEKIASGQKQFETCAAVCRSKLRLFESSLVQFHSQNNTVKCCDTLQGTHLGLDFKAETRRWLKR